jgi:hypothetical protein
MNIIETSRAWKPSTSSNGVVVQIKKHVKSLWQLSNEKGVVYLEDT